MSNSFDVLIVGAGASGALAAHYFAKNGFSVVCLEQGQWVKRESYAGTNPDWELQRRLRWHNSPNVRLMEADYPLELSEADLHPVMFNGVGGSTIIWGAHWHRLTPSDFRVRTLDGVADDWPISYGDLAPFYDRVERDIGVSGLAGDPAYPQHSSYPLPPFPIGLPGMRMATTLNRLGWHWWPGANAIPTKAYRNLNACLRVGTCGNGCAEGAKASTDLIYWPTALDAGARLITGARVIELLVDDSGLATGAAWVDRGGATQITRASIVVVCANGVGTSRLLQLSRSKRFPNGLANSSGLVGKGLMLHPFSAVVGTFAEPMESWLGPGGQYIQSMQFYETDTARDFVRGAKWTLVPSGHLFSVHPGLAGATFQEGWGTKGHRAVKAATGKTIHWNLLSEDLPEDGNRVTLDEKLTDSDGLPAPRIQYRLGENTRKNIAFQVERASYSLKEAGALSISTIPILKESAGHLLGTTRMGHDPDRSVVNPDGRSHDASNLYIFDGGVFVTSGAVNPTATILANALRSTEVVIATRRDQRTAA